MFKDKVGEEALKRVVELEARLRNEEVLGVSSQRSWHRVAGHNKRIQVLEKGERELEQKLDALMELLNVTYEEAHEEPAKLKKGKKEVSLGPKK